MHEGRHRGDNSRGLQPHRGGGTTSADAVLQGIDNPAYYRSAGGGRYYFDTTGTGQQLNMRHPHVLQLIIDSLRYW